MQLSAVRSDSYILRFGLLVLSVGILISLCAAPAWSQASSNASISGLVINAQGRPVAGAEVKLLNPETGGAVTTKTSSAGLFSFPSVQATTYVVTITRQGFSTFRIPAQPAEVGSTVRIDATLQPGAATTFIDAQAAAVQSGSTAGASYSASQMKSAALLGNEASSMAAIATSTTSTGAVAGAMSDQNRYLLDGGSNSDDMSGDNSYAVNFAGVGGTQTGGMPVRRGADLDGERGTGSPLHGRLVLGCQQRPWRNHPDGHQTRHQPIARRGVRLLLRLQHWRGQQVGEQSYPLKILRHTLHSDGNYPPQPFRRRFGRHAAAQHAGGQDVLLHQLRRQPASRTGPTMVRRPPRC